MDKLIGYILGFACTLFLINTGKSQEISGVVNRYVKVDSIISVNKIKISNTTGFKNGDTVLLIQMRGAEVLEQFQQLNRMKGAGRYEFIAIKNINSGNGEVEFRSNMINYKGSSIDDFNAKEGLQMIRVPNYRKAIISSGGLSCDPWNGNTFTGGVIAIIVRDTLILNDSINANHKGFKGGLYEVNSGICQTTSGLYYYTPDKTDSAGLKGEGVVSTFFTKIRGKGRYVNAGGGGNGKYSGGGGGGSHGYGGRGGKVIESCNDPDPAGTSGGQGSQLNSGYFGGTSTEYRDRVIMGGGGGAGTGSTIGAGTNGGNGGGVIIIVAHTLISTGKRISARGENVPGPTSNQAGAGGGGGGGSVLMAVDNYVDDLLISVPGGRGGNTSVCSGMGGGGGGGFIWIKPTSYPNTIFNFSRGDGGVSPCEAAESGGGGKVAYNFYPVGLMFNNIYSSQKICYGETPAKIIGSIPNIVDSAKRIFWQKREPHKSSVWTSIPGAVNRDYQPPALTDTTEYRRIVKAKLVQWTDSIADTSLVVTVIVVPEIKNNIIETDTLVCYGLPNFNLQGKTPVGGNGVYSYTWQSNDLVSGWKTAKGVNNLQNYSVFSDTTKYYRRIVKSDICYNTSDIDTVVIYPIIKDNRIYASQMICENYFPLPFTGTGNDSLSGGNNAFSYIWEKNENDSSFAGKIQVATTQNYTPPRLIQKTYYRRIVLSGLNNTCKDTSKWIRIQITPKIDHAKNTITASQTKCQFITPDPFMGSLPEGGNNSYTYKWERSVNQNDWTSDVESAAYKNYSPASLIATTHFRRIVLSGLNNCCKDTSNFVTITVQPAIANNNIKTAIDTICQNQNPAQLTQLSGIVSGGIGPPFSYTWQQRALNATFWSPAVGATNNISYNPPAISQTMYYRRVASSGVCSNISDSLLIRVLETLEGNTLSGNNEVCRDLPVATIVGGIMSKGDGLYRYSWQDSIPGGTWSTAISDITPDYSPGIIASSRFFRRIVKSGKNDCCVSKSSPFEIKINELPIGSLLALDTVICQGNSLNVRTAISVGVSPYTLKLKGKENQLTFSSLISGTNNLNFTPTVMLDSFIIESLQDSKGCYAKTMNGNAKIRLVTVPVANAGGGKSVCGLKTKLEALPSVGKGTWTSSTGQLLFDVSANTPNDSVLLNSYGLHTLQWTEVNEMCSDSDKVVITFYEQPLTPVLKDTTLKFNYDYTLTALVPAVGSGVWSSPDGINIIDPTSPVTEAKNLNFGINNFVWTITNGVCPSVSDTITVKRDNIERFTGFSPNGDGVNDEFIMEGLDNAAKKKITILNRWGSIVYSSNNYNNRWNGTNNTGNILPDDTYFYILVVDNTFEYKGFIVLKR